MRTCGMVARSAVTMRPLMSLPRAMASLALASARRTRTRPRRAARWSRAREFGTWMPTVILPAMRSMRMDSAAMARQRSSARPVTREYFDAGVGAELEGGDDGAGVDLRDLAVDVELGALLDQDAGLFAQRLFADDGRARRCDRAATRAAACSRGRSWAMMVTGLMSASARLPKEMASAAAAGGAGAARRRLFGDGLRGADRCWSARGWRLRHVERGSSPKVEAAACR